MFCFLHHERHLQGPNGLYTPVPGGEVHCLNRVCVEARAQGGNPITCLEALQPRCDFKVEYCDGVIIKAVLVKDSLSIPLASQTNAQIMFKFGCVTIPMSHVKIP